LENSFSIKDIIYHQSIKVINYLYFLFNLKEKKKLKL